MQRNLTLLSLALCANAFISLSAVGQTTPDVALTRLDCGTGQAPTEVNQRFSDTYAYGDYKVQFTYSCYLIKHNNEYLVWDTGQPMNAGAVAPKESILVQLARLPVNPDQISYVGISHYHGDHTGQVASFPKATLFIGKGDWDGLTAPKPPTGVNPDPFKHWISGGGKVEPLSLDKDVFGDGSVIILRTPGHTPGHQSLLVKLPQMGNVVLSGDFAHFRENYTSNGVPSFNYDRAATLASIDRVKKLATNLRATVILQHDARDIGILPPFPASAK